MSNQIETLMPKIVSRGLLSLREKAILPRLVNSSFSDEAAQHGDHITVPISAPIEVQDVMPSHTPPEPENTSVSHQTISLDHWKRASFYLTDKEMMQIDAQEQFLPLQMAEAIQALATAVNSSILGLYPQAKHQIGRAGKTPFFPADMTAKVALEGTGAAIAARRLLNQSHAPKTGRFGVLDFDAEANVLAIPEFMDVSKSGSMAIAMEGEIGRRFGIDWFSVDMVARSPKQEAVTKLTAAAPLDATVIQVAQSSGSLVPGTLFHFADDAETTYLITAIEEGVSNTKNLSISPAIKSAIANNKRLVLDRNIPVNLIMHRDAVALAMRPLSHAGLETGAGAHMMSVTDPDTGLSLRLEVSRQYKQTVWEFDILWGAAMVRPEWAVRLYG